MELPNLMKNLTTNIGAVLSGNRIFKSIGAKINNVHTDFVWGDFNNSYFLIVTQFEKIGSLVLIEKDNIDVGNGQRESSFDSKTLLGAGDIENELAARYLAEHLAIKKPLYLFSSLKDYSVETLKAVKDICLDVCAF